MQKNMSLEQKKESKKQSSLQKLAKNTREREREKTRRRFNNMEKSISKQAEFPQLIKVIDQEWYE